jgi:DNA-directed RNA polymerase subunit RPC12/RpoP
MATTILIVCPECGKQIKAPDNVIGKRVRCKFCQAAFVASKGAGQAAKPPAGKSAKPPAGKPAKPSKPAVDEDEDDSNPYGMTEVSLAPRCPDCANEVEEDQIVCLNCGYNMQTREKPKLVKTYHNTAGDQFMWLLPGIICVQAIIVVIIFNVWYLMKINDLIGEDDSWYLTMWRSGGIKLWVVIISLFILFFTGKFAIKRLIINYAKPETEKVK